MEIILGFSPLFGILVFIVGASFGSFLGVLAERLATERNPFKGRSYCESCKKILAPLDLIPLFSFIFLRGKCRYCRKKIPAQVFYIELLTGASFVATYFYATQTGASFVTLLYTLAILSCFIVIFFADYKYRVIPDQMVVALIVLSIIYHLSSNISEFWMYLITAILSFLFFFALFAFTKGKGMGFGDVKLSFALGLLFGFPNTITAFYIAFLTGAIVSIILILLGRKRLRGDSIPFGPFLIIGGVAVLFYGGIILKYIFGYLM